MIKSTSNCAGKVIRKLICYGGVYHCIVQDYSGQIFHDKFRSEAEARDYMVKFRDAKVVVEYVR